MGTCSLTFGELVTKTEWWDSRLGRRSTLAILSSGRVALRKPVEFRAVLDLQRSLDQPPGLKRIRPV